MEVHEAVKRAKSWVTDLSSEEGVVNLGLEEIDFDEAQGIWNITLGFSRPWNTTRNALTVLQGEPAVRRTYKVLTMSDDGRVLSLHNRESQ